MSGDEDPAYVPDEPGEAPASGEPEQGRAAAVLDRVTDAVATGVEKVAGALDAVTGGLLEQRLAETGAKVADSLRAVGEPEEDDPDPDR